MTHVLREFFRSGPGKKLAAPGAAMTLPEEHCFVRISQVPNLPEAELHEAIRWEAESVIPLSPAEAVMSWEVLGPVMQPGSIQSPSQQGAGLYPAQPERLEVLIAGAPRQLAASYADLLRAVGMTPVAFEPESFAIARALIRDNDQAPTLLVDLGHDHTGIIITEGRRVRLTANIPIAARTFTDRIAEARKIDREKAEAVKREHGIVPEGEGLASRKVLEPVLDELVQHLHGYFSYFETHTQGAQAGRDRADAPKIGHVILTGGDAMLKGLPEYLQEGIGVPVSVGDPFRDVAAAKAIPRHPLYTTAIGLALYEVDRTEL